MTSHPVFRYSYRGILPADILLSLKKISLKLDKAEIDKKKKTILVFRDYSFENILSRHIKTLIFTGGFI